MKVVLGEINIESGGLGVTQMTFHHVGGTYLIS